MARLLLVLKTVVLLLAVGASQAGAQEPFANPFAGAEAMLAERGKLAARLPGGRISGATLTVRYQASADRTGKPQDDLVINVATTWAEVQQGSRRRIYDFLLDRVLELRDDGTFVSRNMTSDVAFRVYERQNRSALSQVLQVIKGADASSVMDACDAETELGVRLLRSKELAVSKLKTAGATTIAECNDRVVGELEAGSGDAAPAALWPVLAREMTMHPDLQAQATGAAPPPRRIEASFKAAGAHKTSWRLVSSESTGVPYPLTPSLVNATAKSLNAAVAPGLGDLAAGAVAGRAQGGPPTLARWDAEVGRVAKEKGTAAAVLALWPALNMFPRQLSQACQQGTAPAMCENIRKMAAVAATDAAVRALLDVTKAEQTGKPADAVAAMAAARGTPNGDHPALGAAFALALQAGGDAMLKQAQAAGVPSDAKALHVQALKAYPYSPAYWTDLGDYFTRRYDLWTAFALFDVASSLPIPDLQRSPVLAGRLSLASRLRNDFPAFFLPKDWSGIQGDFPPFAPAR